MIQIRTKLTNTLAKLPKRAHPTDAGADLYSVDNFHLIPGAKNLFDTGVAVAIPEGFVGLIFNRSSQGKSGIKLANSVGVIDSDYRGNLKVLLENQSEDFTYVVEAGVTKIAQLVVVPILLPEFKEYDSLDSTQRGTGGFGSTGE
jgi:dUTP pyrophosphatase